MKLKIDYENHALYFRLDESAVVDLTLHKLSVPEALRKTLSSTNLIESCFSMSKHITGKEAGERRDNGGEW